MPIQLEFERTVPFSDVFERSEPFTFGGSLSRLRNAGYERHLRPQEFFFDLQRGISQRRTKEWLSLALENNGDRLVAYLDPEDLELNVYNYIKGANFNYTKKEEFNVPAAGGCSWICSYQPLGIPSAYLKNCDQELIHFLYGRPLSSFLSRDEKLFFPREGNILPVHSGWYPFSLECGGGDGLAASRGVRTKKEI